MTGVTGQRSAHLEREVPEIAAREAASIMGTYARQPLHLVSGEGCWVTDVDGRRYLDALTGLAVVALGHGHPEVTDAVSRQMATLGHVSNLYYTTPQVELAERLGALMGDPSARTFFTNSGAEANEAALKVARRHGRAQHDAKVRVTSLRGSFHGRTLGALAATGDPAKHAPFEPLGGWVDLVDRDDPEALAAAVGPDTCAVLLEVVQGEGGVHVVGDDVLVAARDACDRHGALLIIDEVQTGVGRTGTWFAHAQTPVRPDVVCLAKALANGLPIGAVVATGGAATALGRGDHGSTFGGSPVAVAAALAVLEVIERDGLVDRAAEAGARLAVGLDGLVERHAVAAAHRGRGLLRALVLAEPVAGAVVARALDAGLIVNAVAPDAVRLAPPLVISDEEVDELLVRLDRALVGAGEGGGGAP